MQGSVSDATVVPTEAITVSMVNSRRVRRALLATVSTVSTIIVTSGLTSENVIKKLREAINDGSFLTSLKARSGLPITGIYTTAISDPTVVPDAAALSRGKSKMGK